MTKPTKKITLIDLIVKILDSELPTGTKNSIVTHYLLPRFGSTTAPIEDDKTSVGGIDRPTAEEIRINNDPKLAAEFKDTERLMNNVKKQ